MTLTSVKCVPSITGADAFGLAWFLALMHVGEGGGWGGGVTLRNIHKIKNKINRQANVIVKIRMLHIIFFNPNVCHASFCPFPSKLSSVCKNTFG